MAHIAAYPLKREVWPNLYQEYRYQYLRAPNTDLNLLIFPCRAALRGFRSGALPGGARRGLAMPRFKTNTDRVAVSCCATTDD